MKNFFIKAGVICLASVASLSYAASDKAQSTIRIIGGEESAKNAWPFMTALVSRGRDAFNGQACGASFIGRRYVLTASHCVENASAEDFDVIIGIHDLKQEANEGQRIKVRNIYMHESYSKPVEINNDIAILELEKEVTGVTPVKIMTPAIAQQIAAGTKLTVMGWGNRSTTSTDYPATLHQVNVNLFSDAQCKQNYGDRVTDQMLCAGIPEGGKDSCQGDSGGPLVVKHNNEWYQMGVVSWGDGCGAAGKAGVYAKVSLYPDWVAKKVEGVSLRQSHQLGFVEAGFNDDYSYEVTNFTTAPFNIASVELVDAENLSSYTKVDDQCSGKSLAVNSSCSVKVKVKGPNNGNAKFAIKVTTDNSVAGEVSGQTFFAALPDAGFDVNAAVDSSNIRWSNGGTVAWGTQSTHTSAGSTAVANGDINDNEASILLAVVENANKLSFDYKASTEENYDFFIVQVNGKTVFGKSGAMSAFENKTLELTGNKNRIAFIYQKDQEVSENDDTVYLDKVAVTLNNRAPSAAVAQASLELDEGANVTLDASTSSDPDGDSLSYSWTQVSGPNVTLSQANAAKATFKAPSVTKDETLVFKVTVTDGKGGSAEAKVSVKVKNKKESGGGSTTLGLLMGLGLLARYRKAR
ncbi:trypsin-like serine protease [Pleionea sp. CnH1-48]|uniref:S1 family peptidase n=1 Tax=Pleionea sp. CnH1-48 TaxID=2954494 RepID=UPI00209853A4|nr:trypsin-like serine protease [Pleionea sp. CnH1-48]MCO7225340.1 trypsin-like serine protease [Pleionea sp. CnH1-48]